MKNDLTIAKIKHTDFAELYDKFIIGKKLNQKQYETLLAIAICFTNADDINVQQWGYRIVVEYCNQTQDYMPLYEIAINKGLYPVSKFIERHYIDDDQRNFFTEWNDAFTEQYISGDICRSEQQDALIKFFEKKYNNTISISAPTSYGKSELILSTIKEYKGRKICVLTSTKALLTQTKKRIQQISKGIFPKVVVHPEMYNSKDVSCLAVLTQERLLRVLKKDPALAFDCIIVDEAHEILENNARMELKKKIISEIEFEDTDKDDFEFGEEVVREYLNSLQYSGKKAEKNKIKNMLLLFNVISMQQNTDSNPRFPFDAYQRQKWDIEHIHSVTTDRAQNKKEREEWLEEAKPYIDSEVGMPEDLKAEIDNIYTKKLYEDESAPQYDEMYNKVIAFFSGESSVEEKPINEISNLTLLDQRTNRGYGNHIFPVKRNKILEKSGIESFIPLCTKNVFLKFYSKTVSQMYLWDKHDRQDYFDKMVQTIVDYLAEDIEDMKEEI